MLFNSIHYLLFFPTVTLLYILVPIKLRSALLLAASCYFYMSWKAEYILLLMVPSLIDYFVAIKIPSSTQKLKNFLLSVSLTTNLGLLFFFKYYDFAATITKDLGISSWPILHLLLPVGISFYTFQVLSYTIDVYRGEIPPEKNIIKFALFITYFPQLVAGPIERATHLLHQVRAPKDVDYRRSVDGLLLIAWGLFLKVVVADRLAPFVDLVFTQPQQFPSTPLILATYFFAFQIYGDFAGYSCIAIGSAKILGVDLMRNFDSPYWSHSITDFWRRWHISLSTWFRDYVYIPLGGNKVRTSRHLFNLMLVFLMSGLWHGANYTFIIWGAIHGCFVVLEHFIKKTKIRINSRVLNGVLILLTFHVTCLAWIFFRANSVADALYVLSGWTEFIKLSHITSEVYLKYEQLLLFLSLICIVLLVDFHSFKHKGKLREKLQIQPLFVRWPSYALITIFICLFGIWSTNSFIYFQF